MSTEEKIKNYVQILQDNPSISKKQALMSVGYAESTANNPSMVERTDTFKAIAEHMGLITAGHVAKISDILDKRDFNTLDTKDLVDVYTKLTGTFVKLTPVREDRANNLKTVYAKVINADSQ